MVGGCCSARGTSERLRLLCPLGERRAIAATLSGCPLWTVVSVNRPSLSCNGTTRLPLTFALRKECPAPLREGSFQCPTNQGALMVVVKLVKVVPPQRSDQDQSGIGVFPLNRLVLNEAERVGREIARQWALCPEWGGKSPVWSLVFSSLGHIQTVQLPGSPAGFPFLRVHLQVAPSFLSPRWSSLVWAV